MSLWDSCCYETCISTEKLTFLNEVKNINNCRKWINGTGPFLQVCRSRTDLDDLHLWGKIQFEQTGVELHMTKGCCPLAFYRCLTSLSDSNVPVFIHWHFLEASWPFGKKISSCWRTYYVCMWLKKTTAAKKTSRELFPVVWFLLLSLVCYYCSKWEINTDYVWHYGGSYHDYSSLCSGVLCPSPCPRAALTESGKFD